MYRSPAVASEVPEADLLRTPEIRYWIVPHTHWDREWYLPFQIFRLRLARMVDELLATLEADPSFLSFTLDGQAVLLEDYLTVRPQSEERLTQLIRQGRIHVGPSYVLPDEYLVGQESLVRNLLIGRQVCREYGREMAVAYFPDTFGHVAQMPQIVRGFGLDSFVFWRGLGDEADRLGAAFRWQAPDGSEVLAVRMIDGYGALDTLGRWTRGAQTGADEGAVGLALHRLKELGEAAAPYLQRSGLVDLLAGNGTDHREIQTDLPSLLAACRSALPGLELRIAGLEDYLQAIRPRTPYLESHRGEMCGGRDAAVLRGVNSARMPLKQRNEAVERALQEAEIACSLAYLQEQGAGHRTQGDAETRRRGVAENGDDPALRTQHSALSTQDSALSTRSGYAYPVEELRLAWRRLLLNHPHDSICGCSVDEVHRDMAWRFDAAEHLALRLRREALWKLAGRDADWSYEEAAAAEHSAVNLLPWRRRGLVRLSLPEGLARARGLQAEGPEGELPVQRLREGDETVALVAVASPGFGGASVRLRYGRSSLPGARLVGDRVVENEHYRVEVLADGTLDLLHKPSGRRVTGAHWFEDEADRGDEYNYCPVEADGPWDSRRARVRVKSGLRGPAAASLLLQIDARLPECLRPDRRARRRSLVACPIQVEVRLISGVDRVEFTTAVDNRAEDHRLRVLFPAPPTQTVRVEGHYAVLHRPVGVPETKSVWTEPPAATHHTLGAVEAAGTVLLGRGLPEYEARPALGGTEIALTLLRCVGWLSRQDLPTRPQGWAGPGIRTPEAQCRGRHTFEYALTLVGSVGDGQLVRLSHDYRFPLLPGPAGISAESPLQLEGEGIAFAALKGAEDGDGCVLRVYNPGSETATVDIRTVVATEPCRMDEEPEERPLGGVLPAGRIASFRLRR